MLMSVNPLPLIALIRADLWFARSVNVLDTITPRNLAGGRCWSSMVTRF
jgi:hypothetical protein